MSAIHASRPTAARDEGRQGALHLPLARLLHWTIAALFFVMIATGVLMKQLGSGPVANWLFSFHKMAGLAVLALMLLRLAYRLLSRYSGVWARASGAHPAHLAIYVLAILVPLLGWAGISDFGATRVFFGLNLPSILPKGGGYADWLFFSHAWLAFGLLALVFLHVGIAMRDHVTRNNAGSAD